MKYRKILIVGASGTLGSSWLAYLSRSSEHTAIAHCLTRALDWFDGQKIVLDLANPEAVKKLIDQAKPDLVINVSGATNVDLCEDRPTWAYALNEIVPRQLAQECDAHGCRLVHVSTDHIFGRGSGPFIESARPNPINVYGESKLAGEKAVLQESPDSISKVTWDNVALLSQRTAKDLGIKNKEILSLSYGGQTVKVPAWILPGHADGQISVQVGYGRTFNSKVAQSVGANVYPLMNGAQSNPSVKIKSTGVIAEKP